MRICTIGTSGRGHTLGLYLKVGDDFLCVRDLLFEFVFERCIFSKYPTKFEHQRSLLIGRHATTNHNTFEARPTSYQGEDYY